MHKLTKIPPLYRREMWGKYTLKMKENKWKQKELCYAELAQYYRVHINTIRKIISRARNGDFEPHKSTTNNNLGYRFKKYIKHEKILHRKLNRVATERRYEKEMAGELVHIDVHKLKNIKGENPKKKKYFAGIVDDASRITYVETLSNKRAKTLADFVRRAYKWFKTKGITIKRLLSDNGLEFTTHHRESRHLHSFEVMLQKLNIVHKYTKVRRPQTNGKIERFWRIFNDNFWNKYTFTSHKDFNIRFRDWLTYYNVKRPHWGINNMTPMERLEELLQKWLVCI